MASANDSTTIIFNAGMHTEFYKEIQRDSAGILRTFDSAPTIGAGYVYSWIDDFKILPEINWVLPRKAGERIVKNLFMFRGDVGYSPIDILRMRLGTSVMWLNQQGGGGSSEINNGNGTSTFYYPDENRSSFNTTLDLGVELLLSSLALRLQTYIYAPFKEERRQLSYTLFLSYYWDKGSP
jgi:hypothetical protein